MSPLWGWTLGRVRDARRSSSSAIFEPEKFAEGSVRCRANVSWYALVMATRGS
jgi:hypothetical protein